MRIAMLIVVAVAVAGSAQAAEPALDGDGPYTADTSLDVSITLAGQTLKVDLFVPSNAPPAPLIVGAHGLQGHKEELTGWGRHFATHGFAVAIPQFAGTDNNAAPGNADYEIALLDWMTTQGASSGNFFTGKVDGSRRGIFGHSMGGLVTHLAASKSASIQVAIALDGVDQNSAAANAVPMMHAFPVELRASIQSVCNLAAPAEPAVIAAFPGPYLVLTVANTLHCDPQDPETAACITACTATLSPPYTASPNRDAIKTFRRYATAAMRYKLLCDSDARTNLDGVAEQSDVSAGTITNFTAHNIGDPGGCEATPVDAGSPPPEDAGPVDAGSEVVDAGTIEARDAGLEPIDDAGPPDAGIPFDGGGPVSTDNGDKVPPGGCQCSSVAGMSPVVLFGLLIARRRRFRSSCA